MRETGGIYGSHGKLKGLAALVHEACDVEHFSYHHE
jgi:hypothetical protein